MPDPREVVSVVREWVRTAEADWKAMLMASRSGQEDLAEVACFHAQQCVEKYVKALLVLRGVAFQRTHDVRLLLASLPEPLRPASLDGEMQDRLTEFATVTRYPGDYEPVPPEEVRNISRAVRQARREFRAQLPPAALVLRRRRRPNL